jgi:hypothetical protein
MIIWMNLCKFDGRRSSILKSADRQKMSHQVPGNSLYQSASGAPHPLKAQGASALERMMYRCERTLHWNMKVPIDLHDEVSFSKRTENLTRQTQAKRLKKAA